jgi:MoaA/NifB/PqqE/SkfB family radical SAM enzyme
MYCKVPFNSLTIQPTGKLGICCTQNMAWDFGHISETDDIQDAWLNHPKMLNLKSEDKSISEPEIKSACSGCLNTAKVQMNRWHQLNNPEYPEHQRWHKRLPLDNKIRFLEFTTSNICNQACATCSSFYSTKWIPLEEEAVEINLPLNEWKNQDGGFNSFGYQHYAMSDSDVEKIFKLLPDLYLLYIKGGEPFADNNNYIVLEELVRVNPKCHVHITSNVSKLPEKYLKLLKKIEYVSLSCSFDGLHDTYEYVRSSKFEETIENIKRYKAAQIKGILSLSFNACIYNFYHIPEFFDYFSKNMIEEIDLVKFSSWIKGPEFVSALFLLDEKEIEEQISNVERMNLPERRFSLLGLRGRVKLNETISNEKRTQNIERFHKYTKFMNYKRGINIYDIHPQLLMI